jgi:hypothetical protein
MRDWDQYVRSRLSLPDLARDRESRIVMELASQLEDCYRDALARGMAEPDADAHARAQITTGRALQPRSERSIDRTFDRPSIVGRSASTSTHEKDEAGGSWPICGRTCAMRVVGSPLGPDLPWWRY